MKSKRIKQYYGGKIRCTNRERERLNQTQSNETEVKRGKGRFRQSLLLSFWAPPLFTELTRQNQTISAKASRICRHHPRGGRRPRRESSCPPWPCARVTRGCWTATGGQSWRWRRAGRAESSPGAEGSWVTPNPEAERAGEPEAAAVITPNNKQTNKHPWRLKKNCNNFHIVDMHVNSFSANYLKFNDKATLHLTALLQNKNTQITLHLQHSLIKM